MEKIKLIYHIIASPFIGFGMTLIWAVLFGDSIVIIKEKNMMEEWIACILCYILFSIIFSSIRKKQG